MRFSKALGLAIAGVLSLSACNLNAAADLTVGDCFNDNFGDAEEVSTVPTVDCDKSHNAEVYHVFDVNFGGTYDEDAVLTAADEGCFAAFEAYVGISYEESLVYYFGFYPLLVGWNDGDREVICYLTIPTRTSQFAQGSGR